MADVEGRLRGEELVEPSGPLYVLQNSAAHLLAAAVMHLFPAAKYAVGTPVENGFYYDFEFPDPISAKDVPRIEKRMTELVRQRQPFRRLALPRAEVVRRFTELGQTYKLDILEEDVAADEIVSCYVIGDFFDLSDGPHVADTGEVRAFKLLRVAGAYWRGEERRQQLTRIYGTAWPTRAELDGYLAALETAAQRDHRKLGHDLRLFALDERAGLGNVLWLPNGATVRRELERWIVDEQLARGYLHVKTPVVASLDVYRQSGHAQRYQKVMYPPMVTAEGQELQLRPMACPHHIMIYQHEPRSFRDLPMRIAEVADLYRLERSGELMGMLRVRSFALSDAHLFCTPEQLEAEVLGALRLNQALMRTLGVSDYSLRLSVRDREKDKWTGTDDEWAHAEETLISALASEGLPYTIGRGEAAFYGPKIDFQIRDAARRVFTNNTIQVDFQFPRRFDLAYVGADSARHRPVMIHAGQGAMERLVAFLTEHYAAAFPTWLAPVQVAVLPITDEQLDYAAEVAERLRRARVRLHLDGSADRIGKKIRSAQRQKIPYMLVLGRREAETSVVNVRRRDGRQASVPLEMFVRDLLIEIAERRLVLGGVAC